VEAVGPFYRSQAPISFNSVGPRSFLRYEAALGNGLIIHGTAVIERNPDGSVPRVSVTFSRLGAALSLAGRLGALLDKGPWRGSVPLRARGQKLFAANQNITEVTD
jgi:hypothetical protein